MRVNNILGILFSNSYDEALPELTNLRTMGSVPFGGRYRMIDFPLSSMVNGGISKVGVITKSNYRSLMDHLAQGRPWDLARKHEGMVLLPPFSGGGIAGNQTRMEGLTGALAFLKNSKEEYVIMSDCHVVGNLDYRALFKAHAASGADITVAAKRGRAPRLDCMRLKADAAQGMRLTEIAVSREETPDCLYSLNTFVLRKALLERLLQEALNLGRTDFERDLIQLHVHSLRIHAAEVTAYVQVVDSLQGYYDASMTLLQPGNRRTLFDAQRPVLTKVQDDMPTIYGLHSNIKNCLVADGCQLEGEAENSVLFRGVRIEAGASVRNCILMQGTYISAGVQLESVIADKGVVIKPGKTLVGAANYPIYLAKQIVV
ncbi:MAG: glucose-1-phosphate adenylyltransferase subunit GlgD [Oscillospiraceae bacterium]|jgi:glucose-1-phosphate adenylyltransferase|nr:glucose-1-phosphate adenylyltransferase subunit GlgD [Oscillospiraceae bacterium]